MPKVRRHSLPRALLQHLLDRSEMWSIVGSHCRDLLGQLSLKNVRWPWGGGAA